MRYHRRVIRISAEDSPNVALALAQLRAGEPVTNEELVPGVIKYEDGTKGYAYRRKYWDKVRQCIGLDGLFWEGAEYLLFPPDWLERAARLADELGGGRKRVILGLGCDPGEGGAKTAWAGVDEYGLMPGHLIAYQTADTTEIPAKTVQLIREWNVQPERVCIDRGGGGKQHADRIRSMGYKVRTVAFGSSMTADPRRNRKRFTEKVDEHEERYAYVSRRAQMYHELSQLLDPYLNETGWGIPREYDELRRQLALFPKLLDDEGRYWLPSKGTETEMMKKREVKTLREIIGCSPDEADAVVLAVHAMIHQPSRSKAGAA